MVDIKRLTLSEWNDALPNEAAGVFHRAETLRVLDAHATGELQLYGGFKGQEPLGLLPVFVRNEFGARFVISPPPGYSVPRLGPVFFPKSPKQRKCEEQNHAFTEQVLHALDVNSPRVLLGIETSPHYGDPRPFLWEDLRVAPRFSYRLDLADRTEDDVLNSFTADLRSEIRKGADLDVEISLGGTREAKRVCQDLKERHQEQDRTYPTPKAFVGDLVDELGPRARVYVAREPDGSYLGGITVLYSDDEAVFWQGGSKANYRGVSVNSILHWQIIRDILQEPTLESVSSYDFGNALNRRISRYKSKFDVRIEPHYRIKSDLMVLAQKLYGLRRKPIAEPLYRFFME